MEGKLSGWLSTASSRFCKGNSNFHTRFFALHPVSTALWRAASQHPRISRCQKASPPEHLWAGTGNKKTHKPRSSCRQILMQISNVCMKLSFGFLVALFGFLPHPIPQTSSSSVSTAAGRSAMLRPLLKTQNVLSTETEEAQRGKWVYPAPRHKGRSYNYTRASVRWLSIAHFSQTMTDDGIIHLSSPHLGFLTVLALLWPLLYLRKGFVFILTHRRQFKMEATTLVSLS